MASEQLEERVQLRTQELSKLNADMTLEIGQRRQAEAALALERERFQNLMDFMPDAIYFKNLESQFILVNKAYAKSYGFSSPEDAIGKSDLEIFGNEHAARAFADEQKILTAGEMLIGLEEKEDRSDGRVTWVSSTKVPVRDAAGQIVGLVGISRDITHRKKAEAAFLESALKYQTLIESVSDWVWEANADMEYTYSNPKAVTILGFELEQIIGRSIYDLMLGVEQSRIAALLEPLVRKEQREAIFDCLCLRRNGDVVTLEMNVSVIADESDQVRGFRGVARDVTERRRMDEQLRKLTRALDQSGMSVVISNVQGKIEYVNARFTELTGYTSQEVIGQVPGTFLAGDDIPDLVKKIHSAVFEDREWRGELCSRKKNGEIYWETTVISPIKNEEGLITQCLSVREDITERKRLEQERETMELQLRQAQKLESVGQLAAGIAHEINTPIQYVGDNLRFIQESFAGLCVLIERYDKLVASLPPGPADPLAQAVQSAKADCDIDYLLGEIPSAIGQSLDGVQRVADIVRAMKEFSHPGGKEKTALDINHSIQMTVTVARNEWKYVAEVQTDFAQNLPLVPCFADEFNQVILNLLVNAAHAIGDVVKNKGGKGVITISTRSDRQWVEIRIADTGTGIAEEHRQRIFELFFTTKEVGKGTGQGLALARAIIVKKHGGEITFETAVGVGTTFIVRLPVVPPAPGEKTKPALPV